MWLTSYQTIVHELHICSVKNDDAGMRDAFELTATSISPANPVACKRMNNKRPAANISATDGLKSKGRTGVELRWHKTPEFKALPENQREELKAWCATRGDNRHSSKKQNTGNGNGGKTPLTQGSHKHKKMIKRQIAAMMGKPKSKVANENTLDVDGIVSAIKAMTQAGNADVSTATASPPAANKTVAEIAEVQLRSILHKSKLG